MVSSFGGEYLLPAIGAITRADGTSLADARGSQAHLPFAFLEEGGFLGTRRLLWIGAADTGSIAAAAFCISWFAGHLKKRTSH